MTQPFLRLRELLSTIPFAWLIEAVNPLKKDNFHPFGVRMLRNGFRKLEDKKWNMIHYSKEILIIVRFKVFKMLKLFSNI